MEDLENKIHNLLQKRFVYVSSNYLRLNVNKVGKERTELDRSLFVLSS